MARYSVNNAGNVDRPKGNNLKPLKWALPFLRPYRRHMLLAFICLGIASIAMLGMPVAIRNIIDYGFSGNSISDNINIPFLVLFGLAIFFAVFASLRYYLVMWIGERFIADIRSAVYRHVIRMGPTFFETTRTGEVLSRLTTDTTLVQSVFGAGMSIALRSLFSVVGCLIMLFVTDIGLTLMIVLLIPIVVGPILLYGYKIRKLSRSNQDRIADSNSIADESLHAINVIQSFTLEGLLSDRFSRSVEDIFLAARRRLRVSSLLTAVIITSTFGTIVLVLWTGAHSIAESKMTPGSLGQFLLYALFLASSIGSLGEVWSDIQRAAGALERLMELLHAQPDITASSHPITIPQHISGHIRFEDVHFSYPSRPSNRVLCDFNLRIEPGETVALVGPSGAGKSTIFQLLMRFYEPQSGRILIDDIDIRKFDPGELRKQIAIVPQNTVLFSTTAMENIRYGNPKASDAQVKIAASAAIVDEFIHQQPEGYDAYLGEKGVRLSGGQRQRIAIARAILKQAPIILLDEATSALDSENEKLVHEAFDHVMKDHTTLVIAHRLSTVIKADRIVVMNKGRIIDIGKHQQLIQKSRIYKHLAELQFDKHPSDSTEQVA